MSPSVDHSLRGEVEQCTDVLARKVSLRLRPAGGAFVEGGYAVERADEELVGRLPTAKNVGAAVRDRYAHFLHLLAPAVYYRELGAPGRPMKQLIVSVLLLALFTAACAAPAPQTIGGASSVQPKYGGTFSGWITTDPFDWDLSYL